MHIAEVLEWLAELAPLELSESWDNTGLLLGDRQRSVSRVMTCLTITPQVASEAIEQRAELVVTHHPLPFRPVQQITVDTQTGELLWRLASHGISVYSPHTAWDSASRGINQRLAEKIGLSNIGPIVPNANIAAAATPTGAGRIGDLDRVVEWAAVAKKLQASIASCRLRGVHAQRPVQRVAVACGSGGSLLAAALRAGCDLFITGEATYHTCLEAQGANISLLMIGHFASERFAMEELAGELQDAFPTLTCWASKVESDPVRNIIS